MRIVEYTIDNDGRETKRECTKILTGTKAECRMKFTDHVKQWQTQFPGFELCEFKRSSAILSTHNGTKRVFILSQ